MNNTTEPTPMELLLNRRIQEILDQGDAFHRRQQLRNPKQKVNAQDSAMAFIFERLAAIELDVETILNALQSKPSESESWVKSYDGDAEGEIKTSDISLVEQPEGEEHA